MQFVHHIFNIDVWYIIYILVYIICIYKSSFVLFSLFKILTTCKMVGLHPTIKGRPLNPTIRWAIRTGNSLYRYWALFYNKRQNQILICYTFNLVTENQNIFFKT